MQLRSRYPPSAARLGGDAHGERIVLVEKAPEFAGRSADRTSEEQAHREIAEMLHEM